MRAAAQEQGVNESVILKRLLRSALNGAHMLDEAILRQGERIARNGRLSIRLRLQCVDLERIQSASRQSARAQIYGRIRIYVTPVREG